MGGEGGWAGRGSSASSLHSYIIVIQLALTETITSQRTAAHRDRVQARAGAWVLPFTYKQASKPIYLHDCIYDP